MRTMFVLVGPLLSGCLAPLHMSRAREVASMQLGCPAESVDVMENRVGPHEWTALGCGVELACDYRWGRMTCSPSPESKAMATRSLVAEELRLAEEQEKQAERERLLTAEKMRAVPLKVANLRVINRYAESLFTVSVMRPEADEADEAIIDARVGTTTAEFPKVLRGRPGHKVVLRISAMSLGERREFAEKEIEFRPGDTFIVVYDWDYATAQFSVGVGWASDK